MRYISGLKALNLPCSLDTCGDWHTSAINWSNIETKESNKSFFKDWGIELCDVELLYNDFRNLYNMLGLL